MCIRDRLVILAARNVNFCSTDALAKEVLAMAESEYCCQLFVMCWYVELASGEFDQTKQLWSSLIQVNITVVYLTFKWPFSELPFSFGFEFSF